MDKWYAGIGSRETPEEIQLQMFQLAHELAHRDYWLRSGGALGADTAFENGAANRKCIYLPWDGFQRHCHNGTTVMVHGPELENYQAAEDSVDLFHPAPQQLGQAARKLMARNAYQILGHTPAMPESSFVLCWAKRWQLDAKGNLCDVSGGTGQAVRIAHWQGVPIYNLAMPGALQAFQRDYLED
jgi:hypothetical protein